MLIPWTVWAGECPALPGTYWYKNFPLEIFRFQKHGGPIEFTFRYRYDIRTYILDGKRRDIDSLLEKGNYMAYCENDNLIIQINDQPIKNYYINAKKALVIEESTITPKKGLIKSKSVCPSR